MISSVILMTSTACQYHLPNASTLFPVLSSPAGNTFAVPLQFKADAERTGMVAVSSAADALPQGPTTARPMTPADGARFYDWTLGSLVIFRAADSTWRESRTQAAV